MPEMKKAVSSDTTKATSKSGNPFVEFFSASLQGKLKQIAVSDLASHIVIDGSGYRFGFSVYCDEVQDDNQIEEYFLNNPHKNKPGKYPRLFRLYITQLGVSNPTIVAEEASLKEIKKAKVKLLKKISRYDNSDKGIPWRDFLLVIAGALSLAILLVISRSTVSYLSSMGATHYAVEKTIQQLSDHQEPISFIKQDIGQRLPIPYNNGAPLEPVSKPPVPRSASLEGDITPPAGVNMNDKNNQIAFKAFKLLKQTGVMYSSDLDGMDKGMKSELIAGLNDGVRETDGSIKHFFIIGKRPGPIDDVQAQALEILNSPRHGAPPGETTDAYHNADEMNEDYPVIKGNTSPIAGGSHASSRANTQHGKMNAHSAPLKKPSSGAGHPLH